MPNESNRGRSREIFKGKLVEHKVLGKKKVYFIYHALLRMKERRVSQTEVFETLAKPDETDLPTESPRRRVRKHRDKRISIDVVYELKSEIVRVITVIAIDRPGGMRAERLAQRKKQIRKRK